MCEPSSQEASPLELRQYLEVLKRHRFFIIQAVVVTGLVSGVVSSMRTPVYKATARVLLTPNDPNQQLIPGSGNGAVGSDPDRHVAGQITIAQSKAVADEAAQSLHDVTAAGVREKVTVSQRGQSNVINVAASDTDPVRARDVANAVANGYIENRRKAAVSGLQGAADDIEAKLGPLQTQIAQLDTLIGDGSDPNGASSAPAAPMNPITTSAPTQPVPPILPPVTGRGGAPAAQEALKAARYAAAVQYETLYSRQQELLVDIGLKRGDAELIEEAPTPSSPVRPRPARDAAIGLVVGLLVGMGISLLREQLNDRIRSGDEVERQTGLSLLAQLPYDESAGNEGVSLDRRPNCPLSEAMRTLRTSIQYQGVDRPVRIILVTSALPGEGKSLIAANLAVAYAQSGHQTMLISADLRRPSVNKIFGDLGTSPGLTGLLSPAFPDATLAPGNGHGEGSVVTMVDITTAEAALVTPVSRLLLLPSGPTPPNPAEMLGSKRMSGILEQVATSSDVVVIDTPPLLPVTDAAVLATRCDGVVLVTAANETPWAAIERSRAILEGTGARVLGVVVNKSRTAPGGYDYYGSYHERAIAVPMKRRVKRRLRRRPPATVSSES